MGECLEWGWCLGRQREGRRLDVGALILWDLISGANRFGGGALINGREGAQSV
jgi:hypothetical protein